MPRQRSGHSAAATQAARPPQLCPASTARRIPNASISAMTSAPIAACSPERSVAGSRKRVAPKPRRARDDDAAALRCQLRGDICIGVNVIGKAVQEDRNRTIRGALLIIGDVENAGIDVLQRLHPPRRRRGGRSRWRLSLGKGPASDCRQGRAEQQTAPAVDGIGHRLCLDQLHHRRSKRLGRFLRQIVPGARHHAMDAAAGEFRRAGVCHRSPARRHRLRRPM